MQNRPVRDDSRRNRSALLWPAITGFVKREQRLGERTIQQGPLTAGFYEFLRFGLKQAWACLFGALMLALIVATKLWYPHDTPLARYDLLVLGAIIIQAALVAFRLESWEEVRVILIFHLAGTVMELFKTAVGSWIYPEPSLLRIGAVPLYSGFMYGAIGSYLTRVWRLLDFHFTRHPPLWAICVLSVVIYINFFSHHYLPDIRVPLLLATAFMFGRTTIHYRMWRIHRHMPLLLGFVLVAFFIWIAENIGTGMGAWIYPSQAPRWSMVSPTKLVAWFLLMIVSYTLTALVNRPMELPREEAEEVDPIPAAVTV
jgi:uncharacterized membrane protein YoaT (DUF817 family)